MQQNFTLLATLPPVEDHWIALAVGGVFLCLQLWLCLRFVFRIWRQKAIVGRVARGNPERNSEEFLKITRHVPWLRWVDRQFPAGAKTAGNFTRDDVLKELDSRIAADSSYQLLQRTGVMAPLMGVLITVGGFFALKVPDTSEQQLQDIFMAVTPLIAGVGVGAALAFMNQWLLHVASGQIEGLRIKAREWFDAAIWNSLEQHAQDAQTRVILAMEEMAKSITAAAGGHAEGAQLMHNSARVVRKSADQLGAATQALGREIQGLPQQLGQVTAAVEKAADAFGTLVPKSEQIVAGLDVSVSAFRAAVDNDFNVAAELHKEFMEELSQSVERLNQGTRLLLGDSKLIAAVQPHNATPASFKREAAASGENIPSDRASVGT